jgi:hypothetical protein
VIPTRSLITENEISKEEVKGVFLVWKKVPKEAVVSCEPIMVEKKKKSESGKSVQQGNDEMERGIKEDVQRPVDKMKSVLSGEEGAIATASPKHSRPTSKGMTGFTHRRVSAIATKQTTPKTRGDLGTTRSTKRSDVKVTEEVKTEERTATTKPKRSVLKVTEEGLPIKRIRRGVQNSSLSDATTSGGNSMKTPSSTRRHSLRNSPARSMSTNPAERIPSKSTRKAITLASGAKRKRKTEPEEDEFAVDDVLDHGWGYWKGKGGVYVRDKKGTLYREYLVKWAGQDYENTWEPEPNLGWECLEQYWKTHGPKPEASPERYVFK